jgi:hypothetical protein
MVLRKNHQPLYGIRKKGILKLAKDNFLNTVHADLTGSVTFTLYFLPTVTTA